MKRFRLSSLLLVVMIAALGIGWYVDRAHLNQNLLREHRMLEEERVRSIEHAERISVGSMIYTIACKRVSESRTYGAPSGPSAADFVEHEYFDLPIAMASVWRHERDIDLACQEEGQATKLGSDILSALECDADEFLANVQNGKYRRTHTTTIKRQGTFREFVERCVSVDKVAN